MNALVLKKTTPPDWLKTISDWTPFYKHGSDLNLVRYTFGQKMFTPDDITIPTLIVNERPYAGYLFVGASVMSRIKHENNIDYGNQFEITLGVVGLSALGEQAQTYIHKQIGSDIPQGWNNQLADELTLGLNYSRFLRIIKPLSNGLVLGVNPQISGTVGNVYTYGATGVMFRLGNNQSRDLSPPNIRPGFPGVTFFQPSKKLTWYSYAGFEARAILRNIFLDGSSFTKSHKVEKEFFVGDMQYGLVFMFNDIRIALSNMIRTKEFSIQKTPTEYGLINVSFRF